MSSKDSKAAHMNNIVGIDDVSVTSCRRATVAAITRSMSRSANSQVIQPKHLKDSTIDSDDDSSHGGDSDGDVTEYTSSRSSYSFAMPVMTLGTTTVEEQLAEMRQAVAMLTKAAEEKDLQIAALMNKLEAKDSGTTSHGSAKKSSEGDSILSLSLKQVEEMIERGINAKYGGSSHASYGYNKPYTKRIDDLRMPPKFTPPSLKQFDGKGDPVQHIAHFVETCNEANTCGDLLVKQFVRSLKGNAFDWYIGLEPESIDSWEDIEREFYNRFYSTRRTVSLMELTNTKQKKDEAVADYINRWRSLSLDCKDRLSEISAVEMCMQGMNWNLLYILQGVKPLNFKDLASRAHDMELSIMNHGGGSSLIADLRDDRKDDKKFDKPFQRNKPKESMAIEVSPVKISSKEKKSNDKNPKDFKRAQYTYDKENQRYTLKQLEEKEYPFPDSDVAGMLEDLLDKKVIALPECKRPEEMGRVNDPKYCKYHRIVSHLVEKCFVLKELIMKLAEQQKIILDCDDVAQTNCISIIGVKEESATNLVTTSCYMANVDTTTDTLTNASIINKEKQLGEIRGSSNKCFTCCATMTFNDEDLQLGSKSHNRPLYVTGYVHDEKVSRILVDGGSAVNIMPLKTLTKLGLSVEDLSKSRLLIQGFDQGERRALGMIRVNLTVGELEASTFVHVINCKTSYSMLLGRPWLHDNRVVPSTLHQCLKYYQGDQVKTVFGDTKPFKEVESHFADAKFYLNDEAIEKTAEEKNTSDVQETSSSSSVSSAKLSTPVEEVNTSLKGNTLPQAKLTPPLLHYIPKSKRKEGQSPFVEVVDSKLDSKVERNFSAQDYELLKESTIIPLSQLSLSTVHAPPLQGFTRPLNGSVEHGSLPKCRTKGGFDPTAYKLMAKAGYDFSKSQLQQDPIDSSPVEIEPSPNSVRKQWREQVLPTNSSKAGLGFALTTPIRISAKGKDKREIQHISYEELEEGVEGKDSITSRVSAFDRLGEPTSRTSVFYRLGDQKHIQDATACIPRQSVFKRMGKQKISAKENGQVDNKSKCRMSLIPSRMKRRTTWELNVGTVLKAKCRTIVFTGGYNTKDAVDEDEETHVVTSCHVSIKEVAHSDSSGDEIEEAPSSLEDGGQTTVRRIVVRAKVTQPRLNVASKRYSITLQDYLPVIAPCYTNKTSKDDSASHKFSFNRREPCVVREVYKDGDYKIVAKERSRVGPINGELLKQNNA